MRRRWHLVVVVGVMAAACGETARADVVRWIAAGGGDFSVGGNWDRGTPPGAADIAVLDLSAAYTVTVSQDLQLHGMRVSGGPVTVVMTDRSVRLGVPGFGATGAGLMVSGAARFEGGQIVMGWGNVNIEGAPFEMADHVISDKLAGAGLSSDAIITGVVRMLDSGIATRTEYLAAQFELVDSGLGGERVHIGASEVNGGVIAGSEGTAISGPLHAYGGAVIRKGFYDQFLITGPVLIEGAGTTLERVSSISGGETRVRAGASITSDSSSLGIATTASLVLEDGGSLDRGVWMMGNGGMVRVEPGAAGPTTMEFGYGGSSSRWEFVVDGARSPRFVPLTVVSWDRRIGGTLAVEVANPNALRVGDEIQLFTCVLPLIGTFSQIETPALGGGRAMVVVVESQQVVARIVAGGDPCWSADFDGDGVDGTDGDIERFFACLAGNCCALCASVDFNSDGDVGTDADIEAYFRVLGGRWVLRGSNLRAQSSNFK